MRKPLAGAAVCVALCGAPAVVSAQETTTPTTLTVETSTVEQEVTVTTLVSSKVTQPEIEGVDTDDDDSDKTGLWGLLGLLGLLGLAGLAGRRKRDDDGGVTTGRAVSADRTPRGSSSGGTNP
jgi:carbohydrate-binding DOMON domain-containing protein